MVQPQDVLPSLPGVSKQAVGVHSRNEIRPNCNARYSCDRMDQVRLNRVEDPHVLMCTRLVHFTENENAKEIGQLETLVRGFCFKAPNWYGKFNLNWWAAYRPDNWKTTVMDNLPNIDPNNEIGSSPSFNGKSLCGPVGFVISFSDILGCYASSRGKGQEELELRILGTFLYKREIMYAILVCIKGDESTEHFPLVPPGGTEAFQLNPLDESFSWKVYSTVYIHSKQQSDVDWSWDHLSFAFNCPGKTTLNLSPASCSIVEKLSDEYGPKTRGENWKRLPKNYLADENLIAELKNKIKFAE